jgi:hypothetical protein
MRNPGASFQFFTETLGNNSKDISCQARCAAKASAPSALRVNENFKVHTEQSQDAAATILVAS